MFVEPLLNCDFFCDKPFKMKKLFFFILFYFIFNNYSFSQLGLEVFNYRPTGYTGDIMKPTVGFELNHCKDFDEYFRMRIGLNFASLNSRLDTIPTYAVEYTIGGGENIIVHPGYQIFDTYRINTLAIGGDFRFFKNDKINPYIGFDLTLGYIRYKTTFSIEGYHFGNDMGNLIQIGLRPRIGFEYHFTDSFVMFTQIVRNWTYVHESTPHNYNSFGLGIRINDLW